MNIDLLSREVNELLTKLSEGLGDFRLFFETYELDKNDDIAKEVAQVFKDEMEYRKATDVEYKFDGPSKSRAHLIESVNNWVMFSGINSSATGQIMRIFNQHLDKESSLLSLVRVTECSYMKKSIKDRINLNLHYDNLLVRSPHYTYLFEIGGDD